MLHLYYREVKDDNQRDYEENLRLDPTIIFNKELFLSQTMNYFSSN